MIPPHEERGAWRTDEDMYLLFKSVCKGPPKAWVEAGFSAQAPRLDLDLLKDLGTYEKIDTEVGNVVLKKLSNHLWYLSEELVGLTFFDPEVSVDRKKAMATATRQETGKREESVPKRVMLPNKSIRSVHLEDFVSDRTMGFFEKLNLDKSFLVFPPQGVEEREAFKAAAAVVRNLAVVNDHAERGVPLIEEYNWFLTLDEEQLQFLLQVADHRKAVSGLKKDDTYSKQATMSGLAPTISRSLNR